jgi:hypothetical protein
LCRILLGVRQLPPRRQVDRILKLISAGSARPHVPNSMIGKMLRPFRFDQVRTTLRALIHRFHRMPSFQPLPSPGKLHRGWAGIRPIFTMVKSVLSAVRPANNRQQLTGTIRRSGLPPTAPSCIFCGDDTAAVSPRLAPGGCGYQAIERAIMQPFRIAFAFHGEPQDAPRQLVRLQRWCCRPT